MLFLLFSLKIKTINQFYFLIKILETGIFKLSGHPKDILYKIGIGNRTSQGFGIVEVLG